MKKAVFMMSTLLLAMMVVVGCNHGDNGSDSKGLKLNEKQQAIYDGYIDFVFNTTRAVDVPAQAVKPKLDAANASLKQANAGFMIKDTQEGQPIEAGTSKEDLKKRFIPIKA
ncbi:MAG: hypothetical protein ACTTIZ_08090 [Treponema sp.]